VRIDAGGKVIPWLAESWETSPDGLKLTFKLRKDVKYHDDTPFDADSVKWNIDRYRTTAGSQRSGELGPVDSVDVVDQYTVRFNLKTPAAHLLAALVDRAGMMVSRKAVEAAGQADFTNKAFRAGSGPFILTEAVKDDHITMVKNPTWWGKDKDGSKLPYLDKITIKPITSSDVRLTNVKTGDAQVMNNVAGKDVAGVKLESTLQYQEKPAYSFDSMIPNRKEGFVFSDARYVKAVAMAMDRKEILDKVRFGVGAMGYGPIAPTHFAYDANFKPFEKPDPDGAKKLIQEAGKPLSFEFLVSSGDAVTLQLAQLIQAQLQKASIDAQIVQLEFAQILQQQTDKVFKGVALTGWSGRIDPDGNTYDFVVTGAPQNDPSYSNKEVDRLMNEQRQTTDEAKRKTALQAAQKIFVVDDPARIWYGFGVSQLLTNKKVSGLEPYPDRIIRFQYAKLAK
jgi:peptide/nickel transport system substrate-binding protein